MYVLAVVLTVISVLVNRTPQKWDSNYCTMPTVELR